MKKLLKGIFIFFVSIIRYIYCVGNSLFCSFRIANDKSYYPEKKRKKWLVRYLDNFIPSFKGEGVNSFYNLYGFDTVGSKTKDYVSEDFFWKTADAKNGLINGNHNACKPGSQVFYLRDKYAFYHFMKSHNLPVPKVFALLKEGKYYDYEMDEIEIGDLNKHTNFFVKDFEGQCASFVKHVSIFSELEKYDINRGGVYSTRCS